MSHNYQNEYAKYKKRYLDLKKDDIKQNQNGGGKPKLICNKDGGIGESTPEYFGWDLPDIITCAKPNEFKKLFDKRFKIESGRVIVSDIHNDKCNNPNQKIVENVQNGEYNVYFQNENYTKNLYKIFIGLHSSFGVDDIKKLKWKKHGMFATDIANGGMYDEKYYNKPSEIKNIKLFKWSGKGQKNRKKEEVNDIELFKYDDMNCKEKPNEWNECRKIGLLNNIHVLLPHGFYVGTSGDGGYDYFVASVDNKIIGIGFTN